ncbi:MAG: hypothetical protein ACJ71S_06475 [Acidobacteriaceae bacterium]|jgi:hypothetical protein
MTDGFVNIWVEKHGNRFVTVMETGDGRRSTSQPFRTERAANVLAQKALAAAMAMHPEAELVGGNLLRDEHKTPEATPTGAESATAPELGHEELPA